MSTPNRQFKLAAGPVGMVKRSDFEFTSGPLPEPGPGQVLVRVQYVSLDPAMRGWMNEGRSYIPPVALGEVMRAGTAGKVIKSNTPGFAPGDAVAGVGGVQDSVPVEGKDITKLDRRLDHPRALPGPPARPDTRALAGFGVVGGG